MSLSIEEVLELVPQQHPFRFLDTLLEMSDEHAVGTYRFRGDEFFYQGHFPGKPVTPGVILVEAMCQTGLVALGIHLLGKTAPREEVARMVTLFTDAQVEFDKVVLPGQTVRIEAKLLTWRRGKVRSQVQMLLEDGTRVAGGIVAGMGVARES